MTNWNLHQFKRVQTDDGLCGVCTGLGRYTPISTGWWRLIFLVLGLHGIGFLAYLLLCICFPSEP